MEEIVYRYTYTETWSVSPWGAVMLLTFGFFSTFIVVYFFGAVLLTVCNAYCALRLARQDNATEANFGQS